MRATDGTLRSHVHGESDESRRGHICRSSRRSLIALCVACSPRYRRRSHRRCSSPAVAVDCSLGRSSSASSRRNAIDCIAGAAVHRCSLSATHAARFRRPPSIGIAWSIHGTLHRRVAERAGERNADARTSPSARRFERLPDGRSCEAVDDSFADRRKSTQLLHNGVQLDVRASPQAGRRSDNRVPPSNCMCHRRRLDVRLRSRRSLRSVAQRVRRTRRCGLSDLR